MTEFNYVVYENKEDNSFHIGKVMEPSTYKKVELDQNQAYDVVKINNKADYPGLFDKDKSSNLCPMRKVMCRIDTCDFCEKIKTVEEIKQEYTDIYNKLGYFYCDDCESVLMNCLKSSGLEPIWYIRERNSKKNCSVWIERSRRDSDGKIVNYGPYVFERWYITGWYAYMMNDKTDNVLKPHVTCEGNDYMKSISVDKILKLNPKENPDYNPNDDPIYQ
jgi:hypothetical protein